MNDADVFIFLKKMQGKLKVKSVEEALTFIELEFLPLLSSKDKVKWSNVKQAFENYCLSGKKLGLTLNGQFIDIRTDNEKIAGFLTSLNVSRMQRVKAWFLAKVCGV